MTAYRRALDTFVAELDGVPRAVLKGAILPESDPVVRHDMANGSLLFQLLDTAEDEPAPPKSESAKDDPADGKTQVKDVAPKDGAPPADPPKQPAPKSPARAAKGSS